MVKKLLIICVFTLLAVSDSDGFSHGINMTEYYKMPPIFLLDDYDRCMEEHPNVKATYCFTRTTIKPNKSSELWEYIESFSANKKHHFRHDRLNRGICMNWCKDKFKRFDHSTRMSYFVEFFDNETEIQFDPNSLKNALVDRAKYNKLINMCINYNLKKQYNLMAYSAVEYCVTNQDKIEVDAWDIAFAGIFFLFAKIVIASTLYDFRLKRLQPHHLQTSDEHYKKPVDGTWPGIFVSFSIPRNWYRLTMKSRSDVAKDLRSINAIKFFTMFCVMIGHCALFMNVLPTFNPQYMEKNFYRMITMLLINGATIIQTFFAISGFLLSVQFMKLKRTSEFRISYFWKAILHRYIRLTPVYLFIILFDATWLVNVQDGPVWSHSSDTERTFCRNNWWANLLYVNNIFTSSEPCVQHGWYLAADFQMFVIGIVLHLIFWKFPKSMKPILSLGVLISYIIPAVITYVNKFEGALMALPENQRYAHWYDQMYQKIYIPAYTNFGSFLCGMIGGIWYYRYKQEKVNLKKFRTMIIIWYTMLPVALGLLMSAYIFYEYEFEKPAIWIAMYSATLKNLWGLFGAVIITGMAFKIGWIARDVMCHPIFLPLGRLTFCAYMVHPNVIRLTYGNSRIPIYASDMTMFSQVMAVFLMSYLIAAILCVCIELPISAIQRQFSRKDPTDLPEHTKDVNAVELIRRIE